jgi:glycosyltransferase involved in cell wall biosynthesis
MIVLVSSEERFSKTADGRVWSSGAGAYSFWTRYLDVFDQVRVLARVLSVNEAPESSQRADGENVRFEELPCYIGPVQYARNYFAVRTAVRGALLRAEGLVLRAASPIANAVQREMVASRPFGVEVIGDPYEVFAPESIQHPARPLLRWTMTNNLKRQCRRASAVAYVASSVLPHRYPSRNGAFTTTYSSIELRGDSYAAEPRNFKARSKPLRIVSMGTLEVPYKGFDVLVEAVSACAKKGMAIQLTIVGNGRCRESLEARTRERGIENLVKFTGRVPAGAPVREVLDAADLFILASRTEGLPRAMIEAMARALPCIGLAVGGIPELLGAGELVPRGDAAGLAAKIEEVAGDSGRMSRLSGENLVKAHEYDDSILRCRRRQFLNHVQDATEEWSRMRGRTGSIRKTRSEESAVEVEGLQ